MIMDSREKQINQKYIQELMGNKRAGRTPIQNTGQNVNFQLNMKVSRRIFIINLQNKNTKMHIKNRVNSGNNIELNGTFYCVIFQDIQIILI